jgi:Predicted membrane protein (DUF2306)
MGPETLARRALQGTKHTRRFWVLLIVLCTIGAAAAIRRLVALDAVPAGGSSPFAGLDLQFAARANLTRLHVIPSLLFVVLVPLQFLSGLRQTRPRLHRWTGRLLLFCTLVIGLSALGLSAHPVGGLVESSATVLFGCFFLFSAATAWWHIRNRRTVLHREWATRMVAIALGVATTRPIIGVFFATSRLTGLTPHDFFGPAMWIGFVSTWLAGEAWINYTRPRHGITSASPVRTAL